MLNNFNFNSGLKKLTRFVSEIVSVIWKKKKINISAYFKWEIFYQCH